MNAFDMIRQCRLLQAPGVPVELVEAGEHIEHQVDLWPGAYITSDNDWGSLRSRLVTVKF
jgi:hypothetical protein